MINKNNNNKNKPKLYISYYHISIFSESKLIY